MNRTRPVGLKSLVLIAASLLVSVSASAQKNNKEPTGPLITRTATRHEAYRLPPGGTLTLSAAPAGSIIIEGWQQNAVDIAATIELQGPSAQALDQLALVNTFGVDVDSDHIRILTSGTHDRDECAPIHSISSESMVPPARDCRRAIERQSPESFRSAAPKRTAAQKLPLPIVTMKSRRLMSPLRRPLRPEPRPRYRG